MVHQTRGGIRNTSELLSSGRGRLRERNFEQGTPQENAEEQRDRYLRGMRKEFLEARQSPKTRKTIL